ncbi:hypothetical protein DM02DRAFT_530484 [Periconia macrospinosa]|uniref:SUZ domain-containing protein n=1 Tax=Periconia macrospinosa TaxID=97972 RepID=A0A2V1DL46_9PLEO|nr:hypothetical protein DM02DRAFT_530484 [Periconia macrospinosa]
MPPKTSAVADAWDDDWESLADVHESEKKVEPAPPPKLSKAERRAQHAEFNRQIWESAENPEPMLFLEARNNIPVPATFKPTMKVLARKPPQVLTRNGATSGMAGLSIDDDEDSEEERRKKNEADFEERKARAQKERAEKERRYAEAREKIFGSPAASDDSRGASPSKMSVRGKGRGGRGGSYGQTRSNEQSPARPQPAGRQLYEPSYSPKPGSVYVQKKESSRPGTPNDQEKPIREPRGPQAIGRGGRGFAPRGNYGAGAS